MALNAFSEHLFAYFLSGLAKTEEAGQVATGHIQAIESVQKWIASGN